MAKLEKREMIILGVMGIVILYAAYEFLIPKKKTFAPTATQSTAELNNYISVITAGVASDASKNLQIVVNKAETGWKQDPFLEAKPYLMWSKAREAASKAAVPKIEFAYTGYLEQNKRKIAIINGMEYREGDELDVKGFVLKSISPVKVLIDNRDARAPQTILLQE